MGYIRVDLKTLIETVKLPKSSQWLCQWTLDSSFVQYAVTRKRQSGPPGGPSHRGGGNRIARVYLYDVLLCHCRTLH